MKTNISILAALLLLNTMSVFALTASDTETTAMCGDTVTITATADPGWQFTKWQDGNNENPRNIVITDTTTIYSYVATFTKAYIDVIGQVNDPAMGEVTGGGSYEFGSSVTLTAVPKSKCYKFVKWSDGDTNASRTITVAATAAANTYTAEFAYEEFTVTVSSQTGGSVKIVKK